MKLNNKRIYITSSIRNDNKFLDNLRYMFVSEGADVPCPWWIISQQAIEFRFIDKEELLDKQLSAIENCDLFVLVYPAGRGSHIELGYALANRKPIVVFGDKESLQENVMLFSSVKFRVRNDVRVVDGGNIAHIIGTVKNIVI